MTTLTEAETSYVLERLDRDHITAVAEGLATQLRRQSGVGRCEYQPGDGTSYRLLFVSGLRNMATVGAAGGGSMDLAPNAPFRNAYLLVVYEQRGTAAGIWQTDDFAVNEAASGLSPSPASALAIAELIKSVLERLGVRE